MRNRCRIVLLTLVSLALHQAAGAQVGVDGRVHYSVIGSAGFDDGRRATTTEHTAWIDFPGTIPIRLRYPVPAEPQLNAGPGTTAFGQKYFVVRFRYRDSDGPGTGAGVVLRLKATNVYTGGVATLLTFDSSLVPSTGFGYETVSLVDCTSPLPAFDFTFRSYWFEVEMTRTAGPELPGVAGISIMIGHEWTCG